MPRLRFEFALVRRVILRGASQALMKSSTEGPCVSFTFGIPIIADGSFLPLRSIEGVGYSWTPMHECEL